MSPKINQPRNHHIITFALIPLAQLLGWKSLSNRVVPNSRKPLPECNITVLTNSLFYVFDTSRHNNDRQGILCWLQDIGLQIFFPITHRVDVLVICWCILFKIGCGLISPLIDKPKVVVLSPGTLSLLIFYTSVKLYSEFSQVHTEFLPNLL